jgi:signal transduction histidine kinase
VVREYAQAHGGTVEVIDRGDRPGALLRVRLPLERMEAAA